MLKNLGCLLLLLAQPAVLVAQDQDAGQERALAPKPAPLLKPAEKAAQIEARQAKESDWVRRLTTPDLTQRQVNYDMLLLRAQLDPSVSGFFKRMTAQTNLPGLAWTARLGLRELDLRLKLVQGATSKPFLMHGPYGSEERLQAVMRQLVIEYPAWQFGIQPVAVASPAPAKVESERVQVRTDVLGVYVQSVAPSAVPSAKTLPGLVIALIEKNSIAERMELAVGDVLLKVNGCAIFIPADISRGMKGRAGAQLGSVKVEWIDGSQVAQWATWTPDSN
jgi:hypothetical protein